MNAFIQYLLVAIFCASILALLVLRPFTGHG
jgi:hypothetical protein